MATSVDPDQTAPRSIGAVCTGSSLFAYILNSSVMLSNIVQQTTSADDICRCIFFLGALRVKRVTCIKGLFWPPLEPKTESCFSHISSYWFIR